MLPGSFWIGLDGSRATAKGRLRFGVANRDIQTEIRLVVWSIGELEGS